MTITRHRKRSWRLLIVAATLLFCSCTKVAPVGEVHGTVTRDGKPLDGIQVTFYPDPGMNTVGPTAGAVTDDHGRYQLSPATGTASGVVVGHHKVTLRDLKNYQPPAGRGGGRGPGMPAPASPRRIPALYEDAGTTVLIREVKPGAQAIDIEVSGEPSKR